MVELYPAFGLDCVLDRRAAVGLHFADTFPRDASALAVSNIILFLCLDDDRLHFSGQQTLWIHHIGYLFHKFSSNGVFLFTGGARMTNDWSRLLASGPSGPDYWEYFGCRLVEHTSIRDGARVLDVGCGAGSSLFPSIERVGRAGKVTGIDICPH